MLSPSSQNFILYRIFCSIPTCLCNLLCTSVMLVLGLGLETQVVGLGLETQSLALALALNVKSLALALKLKSL